MVIGLSVSMCIKDILEGHVSEDSVQFIVAGTKMRTYADLSSVADIYSKSYWKKDPVRGRQILWRFFDSGKLVQPRLLGLEPFSISDGHWAIVIITPIKFKEGFDGESKSAENRTGAAEVSD